MVMAPTRPTELYQRRVRLARQPAAAGEAIYLRGVLSSGAPLEAARSDSSAIPFATRIFPRIR